MNDMGILVFACLVGVAIYFLQKRKKRRERMEMTYYAAKAGDPTAQFLMAWIFVEQKDYRQAMQWLLPSSEQGNADAQYMLGSMYYFGRGIPQDYQQAAKWNQKAAEQGQVAAQFGLGIMNMMGHGMPKDLVKAHMWLNLAAANGGPETRTGATESRLEVEREMSPGQIEMAQTQARYWRPRV